MIIAGHWEGNETSSLQLDIAGRSPDHVMLVHSQCQPVTLDEEAVFPAKLGYIVDEQKVWWSLDFVYDRFRSNGEKRQLYKRIQFFKQGVHASEFCTDQFFCHTKKISLPDHALHANCATTSAVMSFLSFVQRECRSQSVVNFARSWMPDIGSCVCSRLQGTHQLPIENMLPLEIAPGGLVRGLESCLTARHRTCYVVFEKQWDKMYQHGVLSEPLNMAISFRDLVIFLFLVEKNRKSSGGHPWPRESVAGSSLWSLQKAITSFLATGSDEYVTGQYILEHNTDKAPPSRRRSGIIDDGNQVEGQLVKKRSQMTRMSPDAIYELLCFAREKTVNMRASLGLLQGNSRLSVAAGCKPNAVCAWGRRTQEIYDSRAVSTMQGAGHFNLVADCSTHAGRETLVSICWSHENRTAALANIQVILPLNKVAPGEMDLCSLVEHLAQDQSSWRMFGSWCFILDLLGVFLGVVTFPSHSHSQCNRHVNSIHPPGSLNQMSPKQSPLI